MKLNHLFILGEECTGCKKNDASWFTQVILHLSIGKDLLKDCIAKSIINIVYIYITEEEKYRYTAKIIAKINVRVTLWCTTL